MPNIHTKIKCWLGCGGIVCQTDCTSMFQTHCALLFPQQLNAPHQTQNFPLFLSYWHSRGHSHLYSNGQKGWDGMARLREQKETRGRLKKKKGKDKYRTSLRGRKSEPKDKGGKVTAILTLFLYRDMSKARIQNNRFLYLVGSYVLFKCSVTVSLISYHLT